MRLTPMRYKDYIWPSNPGATAFRSAAWWRAQLPFGRSVTQGLGQVCRVLEGEGICWRGARMRNSSGWRRCFTERGAGVLVHPVWMTTRAYFTELEVVQEPVPDYVRYRFAFCEAGSEGAALKEVSTSAAGGSAAGTAGRGITPWCRATRFGPSRRETAQRCARCVRSTRRSRTRIGSIPESG